MNVKAASGTLHSVAGSLPARVTLHNLLDMVEPLWVYPLLGLCYLVEVLTAWDYDDQDWIDREDDGDWDY